MRCVSEPPQTDLPEPLVQLADAHGVASDFWDFDGKVTAPLNGFSDAYDYYRRSSSRYYLGENRTPTLIIQSSDDPFVFDHSLPTASELARDTHLELHSRGGHVGFVEGSLRNPGYYLERRIPQWLVQGA